MSLLMKTTHELEQKIRSGKGPSLLERVKVDTEAVREAVEAGCPVHASRITVS